MRILSKIIKWIINLFSDQVRIYNELDEIDTRKSKIMEELHFTLRQRKVEQDEKKREKLDIVYNDLLTKLRMLVARETKLRARL